MLYYYQSPVGELKIQSNGEHLVGVWFTQVPICKTDIDSPKEPANLHNQGCPGPGRSEYYEEPEHLDYAVGAAVEWLEQYFAGEQPYSKPIMSITLNTKVTPFREAVWSELLRIDYGQTLSYGQLAKNVARRLDVPRVSAQAVGSAVGCNPISLLIPCHRVINANGKLGGYGGGLDVKQFLLELEAKNIDRVHK